MRNALSPCEPCNRDLMIAETEERVKKYLERKMLGKMTDLLPYWSHIDTGGIHVASGCQ
jgi:hypothetical protein